MAKNFKKAFKGAMYGQDVKGNSGDVLGFINRDSQITERLPIPQTVYPLGRDYAKMINDKWNIGVTKASLVANTNWAGYCSLSAVEHESVPGIATLWFNPVFLSGGTEFGAIAEPVYRAKWVSARNLDNMTKNWQPGDMQAVDLGLSLAVMQAHVLRRALAIMRDVRQHSENLYYNPVALLRSMGFNFTLNEISEVYDQLWSTYNKGIVGRLDALQWLTYSFPGARRWARLCDNIYRDSPIDSRYAQYYVFMPKYWPTFKEEQLPDGTRTFKIDVVKHPENASENWSVEDMLRTIAETPSIPVGRVGYQQFMTLIDKTAQFIDELFYNDSTMDIIATLNAMEKRNLASDLTRSALIDVERIDFEDLKSDHRAPELYDETILIAIANATNAPYLENTAAIINATTGFMDQKQYVRSPSLSSAEWHMNVGELKARRRALLNFLHPKVLNFPSLIPTQSDYISMSQWTIAHPQGYYNREETPTPYISAYCVGSDYIAGISVLYRDNTSDYANVPTDPRCYVLHPVAGVVTSTASYHSAEEIFDLFEFDAPETDWETAAELDLCQQFAFFPAIGRYKWYKEPSSSAFGEFNLSGKYYGPVVQSDVYYVASADILREFHRQWMSNFYGFPVYGKFGTPSFSTDHKTSSFGLSSASSTFSGSAGTVESESATDSGSTT